MAFAEFNRAGVKWLLALDVMKSVIYKFNIRKVLVKC